MNQTNDFSNEEGVQLLRNRALRNLKPPLKLLPSEWAERKCRIPAGNALPGPVRFRNAPYQVEPLDMAVKEGCYRISLMWGAQTGKSQVQLMSMGYFIDHDPQSIMHMQPSQGDLQTWLSAKFDPMVDNTPSLKEKIAAPRGRDGVNNQRMKQYPGGFLMFAWSGSPKTMRGRSAPKIYPDETDGYERTAEGHPIGLLWQRAATFGDQRLLFETSTPTIKNISHIESAFEEGDQRRWFVDCHACDEAQILRWSQVGWDKGKNDEHFPDTAHYICEHCGVIWDDAERYSSIRNGRWIAEKEFTGHASYHLPELASTFRKLSDIVRSFLEKKAQGDLQTFVNVSLAETWEEEGDQTDHNALYIRREHYPEEVPEGGVVLTCGVDVQDDRLEAQVKAWGVGFESWQIKHEIFWGDPGRSDLWRRLDDFLLSAFQHESGARLRISATCIDSGGHYTDQVYKFVKTRSSRRVFAIKGASVSSAPILSRPSKSNKAGISLFTIGVSTAKELVYGRLNIQEVGVAYCHFPMHYDEEWFEQLCAEKRVTKYVKGAPTKQWIQTRARNEALDCDVYNLAAVELLNPDFAAIKNRLKAPEKKEIIEDKSVNFENKKRIIRRKPRKKNYIRDY